MPRLNHRHPNYHHKDSCVGMIANLSDYIDDDLDEAMRTDVKHHTYTCPQCTVFLKILQRTIDLCKHLETQSLSESFSQKLCKKWHPSLKGENCKGIPNK